MTVENIPLRPFLRDKVRAYCAKHGESIADFIEDAVLLLLDACERDFAMAKKEEPNASTTT